MKIIKKYSIIALLSGVMLTAISIVIPIISFNRYFQSNGSIGIIGGADMPTLLFLIRIMSFGPFVYTLVLGLTLLVCGTFCAVFSKTVLNNCALKTSVIALAISFFGAAGLTCLSLWLNIVAFGKMRQHPFSYPLSIIFGLLSFVGFIVLIVFYVKAGKGNLKIKGIIIDVLTSLVTLPMFFLLCNCILYVLQKIL